MILTCPVCSTRYLVDPRALGTAGRLVRCASCSHTWHQTPPEDAPRRIDLTTPEPPPSMRPGGRVQLPALPPPRERRSGAAAWVLAVIVLVGVAAGGLWWARDQVVGYWPGAAPYYDMAGVPVAARPGDLQLKVTTSRDTENGLPTLVIEGEVLNVSRVAHEVPKLRVILQDNEKHELQSWSFGISDEALLPGGRVPFRTSIAQPSEAATGVIVLLDTGS